MSDEQMEYFYKCAQAVDAQFIDYQSMAVGRVMTDKEGQKGLNKSVDAMKNALFKDLIRK